jgi:hypothetical protein
MKKSLLYLFLLGALFVFNSSVQAQSQDFSMTNNTGMTLIDVFISPSDSESWGSDVIPGDLILDGETFNFTFTDVSPEKCMWDIMFTAEDGVKYYMRHVNLCELTTITLTNN